MPLYPPPAPVRRRYVRRRGVGDAASCPSFQQLLGISDASDPCQASSAIALTSSCYPADFTGPLPAGASYCSTPVGAPAPLVVSSLPSWAIPAGIGVLVFSVLALGGGRR